MKFSLKLSSFSKAVTYTFLGFLLSLTIGATYAAWNSVKQSGDTLTSADWNDLVSQIGAWNRASSAANSNVSLGTTGNVGIGTASPNAQLELKSDNNSTGYTEMLRLEGGTLSNGWERGLTFTGNSGTTEVSKISSYLINLERHLRFTAGGMLAMTIRESGNVGIGTASPTAKLDITGSQNIGGGGKLLMSSTAALEVANSATELRINGGGFSSVTVPTGNVGIGTTSPNTKLDVTGPIQVSGTATSSVIPNSAILSYETNLNASRLIAVGPNTTTPGNLHLTVATSAGNQQSNMVLTSSGNVGIGTTSPSSKLHINETTAGRNTSVIVDNSNVSGGYNAQLIFRNSAREFSIDVGGAAQGIDASGAFAIRDNISAANRLVILSNGNVGIGTISPSYKLHVNGTATGTSWTNTSDKRLKKNIQPIASALDKVEQLEGVNFEWRKDEFKDKNFPEGKQMGFIAQEVEKVLPEVVTTDNEGYKGVEYANITAVLVEAIKEQQKEIESLRAEIDNLKE